MTIRNPDPEVPGSLDPLAREVLEGLRGHAAAEAIVLVGGVALQHYCDFRATMDIDASWAGGPRSETRALILSVMQTVAANHGLELGTRTWGETQSYELKKGAKKVFSFKISLRDVQLEAPLASAWDPVKIETFRDNLGAKMNALVERGAPRDFLDAHEVCREALATETGCWEAWSDKNPGQPVEEARAKVLHHLEALELRRPLASISTPAERQAAQEVRRWVRESLCGGSGS
jgi:hypothetical protein